MTVDVEDYFQVSAFEDVLSASKWDSIELRVEKNTHRLLDLFAEHEVKSTFFTLAWVAQRCPNLITRIVADGHELASHGVAHKRLTSMTEQEAKEDIETSKAILEDLAGTRLVGYRAPSFSVNENNQWVYQLLVDAGFEYSSSTYPIQHDLYGVPNWPRFKYKRPEGIVELPIPTIVNKGKNVGIGGGGYFRLYPYWLSKRRIETYLKQNDAPYSFYFHPWEIDSEQPVIKDASFKSKVRHYINLKHMEGKLTQLLGDYRWGTMQDAYGLNGD